MENTVVIIFVLYQTKFSQTPSYDLLKQFVLASSSVHLFIYDNSPEAQTDPLFEQSNVVYQHDAANPGLAKAYNHGIDYFNKYNGRLLLLLDQDTVLVSSYLEKLLNLNIDPEVSAYVPLVTVRGQQISPVFSDKYVGGQSRFPKAGTYTEKVMAINSGTVLPAETIKQLQAFNVEFPLDFLDHWIFWKLQKMHKKITVLDDMIEHDLSVLNYKTMTAERYASIIKAETLFYQKYDHDKFAQHKKHLVIRGIKQFIQVRNRKIWRQTLSEYFSLVKGN